MTSIIIFIVVASTGILSTILIIRKNLDKGYLSNHRYAMILSLGISISITISFFAAFFAPGVGVKLSRSIIIFGMIHAVVWIILMYIITRFILKCLYKIKK